jgi:hypothetical protein
MRHDHDARQPAAGYARKVELRSIKEGEEMPGALTHWEPFAELGELRIQLDRSIELDPQTHIQEGPCRHESSLRVAVR